LYVDEYFEINNYEMKFKNESSRKAQWDYDNSIAFAEKKAFLKGMEEGREEARKEAYLEAKLGYAKNMVLESTLSDEQVAKFLDIDIEVVQKIRAELNK
jgi:hypothetical protein